YFFFSSRRRHTRFSRDWSSDVCSSDLFKGSLTGFVSTSDDGVTFDSVTNTMSQQKERIWGVEATGDVTITDAFTMGTVLSYRERSEERRVGEEGRCGERTSDCKQEEDS